MTSNLLTFSIRVDFGPISIWLLYIASAGYRSDINLRLLLSGQCWAKEKPLSIFGSFQSQLPEGVYIHQTQVKQPKQIHATATRPYADYLQMNLSYKHWYVKPWVSILSILVAWVSVCCWTPPRLSDGLTSFLGKKYISYLSLTSFTFHSLRILGRLTK